MRINTKIERVNVEIDGKTYEVAEKTVGIAEKLRDAETSCYGMPEYRLWLKDMEILLGADAVGALFPDGNDENLDRMERIHDGVLSAFDYNATKLREEHLRRQQEPIEPVRGLYRQIEKTFQAAEGANMRR